MPSPEHLVLNHQEKLVCAERVLQESLGDLEALIPPHDLTAKKALRDAREATQALPMVASSTAQGIGMGYAWRHGGIEREVSLSAPRRAVQELKAYSGPNVVHIPLFKHAKQPPSPPNDEPHHCRQCADIPPFKMLMLAKGKFYDAPTTVEIFIHCEETVGTPTTTVSKELLRKRQGQCRLGCYSGWRPQAQAPQRIIRVRKSTCQNHGFQARIRSPEVCFQDSRQSRCGRKTFAMSTYAFLRVSTQDTCLQLLVCRHNIGHLRHVSAMHADYVRNHSATQTCLRADASRHAQTIHKASCRASPASKFAMVAEKSCPESPSHSEKGGP